jgi:SAM-dependent methyltransferase
MNVSRYLKKARCPSCNNARLSYQSNEFLVCEECGQRYPVVDGVPRMMPGVSDDKSDNGELRKKSYEYWDGGIPGTVENGYQAGRVTAENGTKEWYFEGDRVRYDQYKALEGFCEFSKFAGSAVLDIGPGRGQETHNYANAGADVTVLEYAGQGVDIVRKRIELFDLDVDLIQGDAVSLPFDNDVFDLVFSYGVLHHIPDMKQSVSEVHRVLKPGGIAKIMVYHKGYFYYKDMFLKWYLLKANFLRYSWPDYKKIAMEQRSGPCPVVYIMTMKEIFTLFENFEIVDYFNDEVIGGRLIRWGIIPKFILNRFRNYFGAYSHLTLRKPRSY